MRIVIALTISINVAVSTAALGQSNIDSGHKFSWGENVGWANWRDAEGTGQGVVVSATFLSGYIWGEHVGWLNVGNGPMNGDSYANTDSTNFGVNIDSNTGSLFGLAWGQNIGWVNFDTSTLGSDQARFDTVDGRFRGYAWGENIGWVNLDHATHFVATGGSDIPTVSEWGMIVMALLVLTTGTLVCARRRPTLS